MTRRSGFTLLESPSLPLARAARLGKLASPRRRGSGSEAFTLLELSIVLVIIGLIVGGITAGSSLIKNAELNSVVSDIGKIQSAVNSYQYKYSSLPGDMSNTFDYWGHATTPVISGCTTTGACNGDGDGNIEWAAVGTARETWRFWQGLSASGNYPGTFSGVVGSSAHATFTAASPNIPASKMQPAGYGVYHMSSAGAAAASGQKNRILVGGEVSANTNNAAVLSPPNAQSIDRKYDDGLPSSGKMLGIAGNGVTATNCVASSAYAVSLTDTYCVLLVDLQ